MLFKVIPDNTLSFETSLGYVRLSFQQMKNMSAKGKNKTKHFFSYLNQISNIQILGQG